jgi:hypothetical protein
MIKIVLLFSGILLRLPPTARTKKIHKYVLEARDTELTRKCKSLI